MAGWTYYASGSNEGGQMVGFASVGQPFGVAVDVVGSESRMGALEHVAGNFPEARIFVDNGAFSDFQKGREASDEAWRERLSRMVELAHLYGGRMLAIAPDKIGDQRETLRRLAAYREYLQTMEGLGATVAIPVQEGALPRALFATEAISAAGLRRPALSVPMKAAPATLDEILAIVRAQPAVDRVHLLGLGPERSRELQHQLELAAPHVSWSLDSNLWRSKIGQPGSGRPGAIHRAVGLEREEIAARALSEVFDGEFVFDPTELMPDPGAWIPYVVAARARLIAARERGTGGRVQPSLQAWPDYVRAYQRAEASGRTGDRRRFEALRSYYLRAQQTVADDLGLSPGEARSFFRDPTAFLHELERGPEPRERWEWDYRFFSTGGVSPYERLYQELVGMGVAQRRKALAIVRAWRMGLAPRPIQVSLIDLDAGLAATGDMLHEDVVAAEVERWGNPAMSPRKASSAVRRSLSPDLLKPEYRRCHEAAACHRTAGHCYAASEAFYHLVGGKRAGYKPMQVQHEGVSHWFVVGPRGAVWDLTAEQFDEEPPYDEAEARGFLTKGPSRRARQLMRRAKREVA